MENARQKSKHNLLKIFIFVIAVLFLYSFIEPYLIEEKTTVIQSKDIPQNFSGKKIIFVSDIHHGKFFSTKRVADLVERINRQHPDIIILGGDYVYGDEKYIEPCFEELSKLKAPLGVYAITGNHDKWENYELTAENIEKAGITNLDDKNEILEIGDEKINLAGIGWNCTLDEDQNIIDRMGEKNFSILTTHDPGLAEKLDLENVNFMLSGHNHGGQITFFGIWAFYLPSGYGQKYRSGLVEKDNTEILVSNGVGTAFLPMRFFARPQINIIILKNA